MLDLMKGEGLRLRYISIVAAKSGSRSCQVTKQRFDANPETETLTTTKPPVVLNPEKTNDTLVIPGKSLGHADQH